MSNEVAFTLAKKLPQAHKRLVYWRRLFNERTLNNEQVKEVQALLSTYALLISKLSRAFNPDEIEETETKFLGLERQLTTLFEFARLRTSNVGSPSINHMHTDWDK